MIRGFMSSARRLVGGEKDMNRLYVRRIPKVLNEHYLTKYFSQFGDLRRIYVQSKVPTWSDTKYAFVCYDYPEDAAEAAKNATRIGSSNLKVEYGKKDTGSNDIPTSKSLIVRNINLHHTTKAVRAMLETFGQIKYMTAMRRPAYSNTRFTQVCYQRLRDAKKAHSAIRQGQFYKGAVVDYHNEEFIAEKIRSRGLSAREYLTTKRRERDRLYQKQK